MGIVTTRESRRSGQAQGGGARSVGLPSECDKRRELGQFLTPPPVADFMASLFQVPRETVELLDAGAGTGVLSSALVRRFCGATPKPKRIAVTAFEIDGDLLASLRATLASCRHACDLAGIDFSAEVCHEDFIAAGAHWAGGSLFVSEAPRFTTAIANPPYRKIRSESATRRFLRSVGMETSNLYSGFVSLIVRLLRPGGELVAITPRSFCNGPYFRPFRIDFLEAMSLRRVHVFDSRAAAFRRYAVLQENVIVHAVKEASKPHKLIVSKSSGEANGPVKESVALYEDVVLPGDFERFIHLPVEDGNAGARLAMGRLTARLAELGLNVSTGRVVGFRAKAFLRHDSGPGMAPLIYPCHFDGEFVRWPMRKSRKPNALVNAEQTRNLCVPAGVYVLVKRFTAKEERRRVVACIYDPDRASGTPVAFENHLNYFHMDGHGIPIALARGLAAFLNSAVLDIHFRTFSGHTQVNATDLRRMTYPSREALERLGDKIKAAGMDQGALDDLVQAELFR